MLKTIYLRYEQWEFGGQRSFLFLIFFSKREENGFKGRNFLLVVLFNFSPGLHSERDFMTGIINVKIHFHLPPVSKF